MKIRSGFVSNSSSSSFIASKGEYSSSLDIALDMIPLRDYERDQQLVEKVKGLKGILPDNTNITFSSINYDTFIYEYKMKGEDVYVIETCNNHMFYEIDKLTNMPEEFENELTKNEIVSTLKFYDVELDLFYKKFGYYGEDRVEGDTCPMCTKHYCFFVILTEGERAGDLVCPSCYAKELEKKKPIEVYERKIDSKIDMNDPTASMGLYKLWQDSVRLSRRLTEANEQQEKDIKRSIENIMEDIKTGLIGD